MSAEIEAASASRPLGGRRVHPFDGRVLAGAIVAAAGVACVALAPLSLAASAAAAFAIAFAGRALVTRHQNAGTRRINEAAEQIANGNFDAAEKALVPVATGRYSVFSVALALLNLGAASFRRGDVANAILLYRASLALNRRQKIRSLRSPMHVARASLALALVCAGELDDAERVLAEPLDLHVPSMLGSEVLTRALILLRRGDPRAALDALEREKLFLRNACAGDGAALALAIEASAHEKLEAGYREGPSPRRVPVDPDERAYVLRALPGAESVLVDA